LESCLMLLGQFFPVIWDNFGISGHILYTTILNLFISPLLFDSQILAKPQNLVEICWTPSSSNIPSGKTHIAMEHGWTWAIWTWSTS
jgi:hypothetical protein